MVLLKQGIERCRDLYKADLSTGIFGTSGTEVTEGDTALGAEVAGTSASLVKTDITKGMVLEHTNTISMGSGNTVREFGVKNGSGTVQLRVTFPEIELDGATSLSTSSQILFIQEL